MKQNTFRYNLIVTSLLISFIQPFIISSNASPDVSNIYKEAITIPVDYEAPKTDVEIVGIDFDEISSEILNLPVKELVIEPHPLENYNIMRVIDGIATAYDLSVRSCGKKVGSKGYGLTRSGESIADKTRDDAMCVAVDRRVIPLYSKVYIEFYDSAFSKYNGVYTALDTGSGVKGNHVDIFMGDFKNNSANPETLSFGKQDCKITIVKEK